MKVFDFEGVDLMQHVWIEPHKNNWVHGVIKFVDHTHAGVSDVGGNIHYCNLGSNYYPCDIQGLVDFEEYPPLKDGYYMVKSSIVGFIDRSPRIEKCVYSVEQCIDGTFGDTGMMALYKTVEEFTILSWTFISEAG